MAKAATARRDIVTVRFPEDILRQLDRWRRDQGTMTRRQAIQRLVEQALGTDPTRRPSRKAEARAAELAALEIDRRADPSADADEQAKRKRRLLKGPQEFRRARRGARN